MESQDEEYQCSDCGAVVSANIKVCPDCGAELEDIIDEENIDEVKFVEIPVTSHPVNLPSILSLLDEKKIEYSINEDSMENIWGPNFIQHPRLLIRENQYDVVNELIENIEQEEIEVLDSDVFKFSSLEKKHKISSLKGIEGWLLVISLLLILGPIAYIPYYVYDFFESQNYLSKHPIIYTIVFMDLIIGIYISYLSINAGLKLYNLKPDAVSKAISYFNIFIIYQIFGFILIGFSFMDVKIGSDTIFIFDLLITETIYSIAYSVVAKLYLQNSERVKKTFTEL